MIPCTLAQLAQRCGGILRTGDPAMEIGRLERDTRLMQQGDAYVALVGERFDGHAFIAKAASAGAVAAIVSAVPTEAQLPEGFGVVEVADTLVALQTFAADYRKRLNVQTIAVTGSAGKTSTKEMIASVLSQGFKTHATEGNLNNHIGVPLTLLSLDASHQMAVVEMGMNHPGELAPLVEMAQPRVGVVTNIGTAHIEFFENQQGIACEKSEVVAHLPNDGVAILNTDSPFLDLLRERASAPVTLTGTAPEADWLAENIEVGEQGMVFDLVHDGLSMTVRLPLFSRPMVGNALLAAAVGGACGLTIEQIVAGLESVTLPGHRMKVIEHESRWIINDAYNANTDSMHAALHALAEFPAKGRRHAVLGSMGELGDRAAELHEKIGRDAADVHLDTLIAVGPNASDYRRGALDGGLCDEAVGVCEDHEAALNLVREVFVGQGDCLLVKGSRFMQLDKLVKSLTNPTLGGGN